MGKNIPFALKCNQTHQTTQDPRGGNKPQVRGRAQPEQPTSILAAMRPERRALAKLVASGKVTLDQALELSDAMCLRWMGGR